MRFGRRDLNHAEIRDELRKICGKDNVRDTADLGDDFPDLVVGWKGQTFLIEIKSSKKKKLLPGQAAGIQSWRGGPWARVDSLDDALAILGLSRG